MSSEITVIDRERLQLADTIDQRIQQRAKVFILNTLIDLGEIHKGGYFRELGYNSLNVYIMERLNLSPGHASRMVAIIDKILPRLLVSLRNFSDNSLLENKLENGTIIVTTDIKSEIPFDTEKLYALSKLKPEWINDLFEKGRVRLRGKWITLEDISRMSRQQVFDIVDAALNARKTPEQIKEAVIPWKRYKVFVYTKMKRFQGDLQEIHESPSLPEEVRADLDEALKGLDIFWDKYFPEVPETEE